MESPKLLFFLRAALCASLSTAALVQVPINSVAVASNDLNAGSYVEYHTVGVTIGTPPQRFNLTLDFTSNYAYVFAHKIENGAGCTSSVTRRYYNSSMSSSYKMTDPDSGFPEILGADYFHTCDPKAIIFPLGAVGRDRFALHHFPDVAPIADFAIIGDVAHSTTQPFWPSDGVLGFARFYPTDPNSVPPVLSLAKAVAGPIVTLFPGVPTKSRPGALTPGTRDPENCHAKEYAFPQNGVKGAFTISQWSVNVRSIRLGSFVRTAWSTAAVTAKTKTRVPTADFAGLVKATGAEYDFASDEYVLSCDATILPDLVFVLNAVLQISYETLQMGKVHFSNV